MERNPTCCNLIIAAVLALSLIFPAEGETADMSAQALSINVPLRPDAVLDPFASFELFLEIVNHSSSEIRLRSADDVRVTLSTGGTTVYTRSLELPATAAALRERMREKGAVEPLDPVIIPAQGRTPLVFNTYNTLPFIASPTVDLSVSVIVPGAPQVCSNPVTVPVRKYTVVDSRRLPVIASANVHIEPKLIDLDDRKAVAVYFSNYPVFDRIPGYGRDGEYPNYESVHAVLSCPKDIARVIPVSTHELYPYDMQVAFVTDNRLEIAALESAGYDIIHEYNKVLSVKIPAGVTVDKVMRYFQKDKPAYLLLVSENGKNRLAVLQKGLSGWGITAVKRAVDLQTVDFDKINPMEIL